jgi:hypothetical protein
MYMSMKWQHPVIEPTTSLLVAQCLKQLHHPVPTIVLCCSLFLWEWKFTAEHKLTVDILYYVIMWVWTKSLFHHKSHQLPTVALNCYCESPTAFCKQSQLKEGKTVRGWVRGQVLFHLKLFIFAMCRRAVQLCWGRAGSWLVVAQ